nr:radical SAM protein [uncultured Oscillibacter sp.]
MHYTGTIWRPPYEAGSLLLEVTAGCTHHRCKFCTLYEDLPFRFRMSPLEQVESDLREAQMLLNSPMEKLAARLQSLPPRPAVRRVFLVGANPFVLRFDRLKAIAELIGTYLPSCETIGCFARVTDVALKSDGELRELRHLGYDGLSIGVETGDDQALAFMDKGYQAKDIVEQAQRLDHAGIGYCFMYLAGLAGAGKGVQSATASAEVFNRTHPRLIGSSMLTVYPASRLYQEVRAGNWTEAGELEKLEELRALIVNLQIPIHFATLGASNAVWVEGRLPEDREAMLARLAEACDPANEARLRRYREQLDHL